MSVAKHSEDQAWYSFGALHRHCLHTFFTIKFSLWKINISGWAYTKILSFMPCNIDLSFLFYQHMYYVCAHTEYQSCSNLLLPRIQQTMLKWTKVLFYFFCDPYICSYYDMMLCLFSPAWYFKTSSKSRLTNSMVAYVVYLSSLSVITCFFGPAVASMAGRLRPALTFSHLWVSLARACFHLLLGYTHNYLKSLHFRWIFLQQIYSLLSFCPSPSPHFLYCSLSLLPHHNKSYNQSRVHLLSLPSHSSFSSPYQHS